MDDDHSLNASRPTWGGFVAQGPANQSSSLLNEPWGPASRLDATRPAWDESASLVASWDNCVKDGERVANDVVNHQDSRPVDFLKLVGLWATANRHGEAVEEFRAEGSTSMRASKTLGRGLSFNVHLVGVDDRTKQRLRLRSPFVVYKKLRGLTDKLDIVERGELLRAVLLEVRVLTHPPLRAHNNIAKLIQLVWEPDPDLPDQAWPVLVLEYAENGTLADFQIDYPKLPFSLKRKLCQDVGHGLWALHSAGIVHGDLKSENVLICDADDESRVVAKLADFGCAVTDLEPSDTLKLPAFTLPWNAPESHDRLPRDLLQYTDVYSYGLLVWRVVLDGVNPFRHINTLASLDKGEFQRQVELFKMEDRVLPLAKSTLRTPFCNTEESDLIANLLDSTLQLDASKRKLHRALELLCEQSWAEPSPAEPLMQYEYENVNTTVLAAEVTPMCLQRSIIRELETLSMKPGGTGAFACLRLFELYMERLEWPGAADSAAKWYLKAIEADPTARIACYASGVFELLQRPVPPEIDPAAILKSFARRGCYRSLMELRRRSPSDFPVTLQEYRRHGGVLRRDEKHENFYMTSFDDFKGYFDNLLVKEQNNSSKLSEMAVSKNDDLLLHAASRYGCTGAIDHLLSLGVDINSTNRDGETALFQACRAGSLEAVELLLGKGADPAIAASTGETPLHWVFAFHDGEIERATYLLLTKGGEPCLYSTVAAGRSSAVEYLTLSGTPLHYAVQAQNERAALALLSAGADPFIDYTHECEDDASSYTPFRLAVKELLADTIRVMMGSPISAPSCRCYFASKKESILHSAVVSSSKTIRRIALGANYVTVLIEMIDLLRTAEPKEKALESGMSLLHACIAHGIPAEAMEHFLKTGSKEDLELISNRHGHTPLQVAMHLNRGKTFLLLLNYGADIYRRLLFPEGFSYLQFCAHLGPRAVFFANELISRGAVLHKVYDPDMLDDPKSLSRFAPPLFAIMMGNFELATFLTKLDGSKHIIPPTATAGVDIFWLMFRFLPRLPVSRLRYLLEPPEGLEPVAVAGFSVFQRNCFHAISAHTILGDLELLVNFRYLLEQSKLQGHQDLLNQLDTIGFPPLLNAIMMGRLELVREMLSAGADPNLGAATGVNWAYTYLKRLQKAPSQAFAVFGGHTLTRREARWLQEDYKSIIVLLKQHGGQEVRTSNGMIQIPYGFAWGYLKNFQRTWVNSYQISKEQGKEMAAQQGLWKSLQQIWKGDNMPRGITHGLGMSMDPLGQMKKSIQQSHRRYQDDLARRNRFSASDDEASRLSEASTLGSQLSGVSVQTCPSILERFRF
ncbi:hypothetical protein FALCPG4_015049 [Fusarium falciforme]